MSDDVRRGLTCEAAEVALRDPDVVMRLSRLGSAHPMRLSFLRVLLRRVEAEGWHYARTLWKMDSDGVGRAVYRVRGPERTYSLVAFAQNLPDDQRTDRVIATAWDATFALMDGEPTSEDLDRLQANVPLQEAGRVSRRELSLSRANRSVRLFGHVVERLAAGSQPDAAQIEAVGYLMRTTAVYGSGKFGAADRAEIADRPEMRAPFQAEMLSVWLTRTFTIDLAEHVARARGGAKAVRLDPAWRRRLGVGNSTGLGLAPFLVRHPALLNNWMTARERALARVRALPVASDATLAGLRTALAEAEENARLWASDHPMQQSRLADLRRDLAAIGRHAESGWDVRGECPWDALWRWGEAQLSEEGQEALLALLLEPHGAQVDDLAATLHADEESRFAIDGRMTVADLQNRIERDYGWIRRHDFNRPEETARFWYVSVEKLEPRLGDRRADAGADLEQPLGIAREVARLGAALAPRPAEETVADFLAAAPEHRHIVRRVQALAGLPYAEMHDNILSADTMPIDILRCKLAFFGASRFDPRSDRWVRINLFQDFPHPDEICRNDPI